MRKSLPFLSLLFLLFLPFAGFPVTKLFNISITVKGLNDQKGIMAYYADDKKYIFDTLDFDSKGVCRIKGEKDIPDGVYLMAFPSRNFEMFDFIIHGENAFSMSTDTINLIEHMQVNNSLENKVMYEDLKFMVPLGKISDSLKKTMKAELEGSDKYNKAEKELKEQSEQIKAHREKIVEAYPKTFYANLIRLMQEPEVPKEYLYKNGTWKDTSGAADYIRDHYFDVINFADTGYIRCPVYKNFVISYFDNYVIPVPDTMNVYIDKLIEKAGVNKEQFQYILSVLFNKYANSQIMGYDAIMVHMAEKYFLSGMAWWSEPDNLKKLRERVEAVKPTLIGQTAPNFIFQDSTLKSYSFHSLVPKKRYTMLVFWNSDCGHCQHEIPALKKKFEDSLKTFDFQVVAVSTEQTDSSFRAFTRKNTSAEWVTGWDPWGQSAFRHDYDVISTPKIYIIDRQYKILGKGVGVDDLYKFLEFYSREPEAKN